MRTLKCIVEDQIIKPNPECDYSGLVPGTSGYLEVEFEFSQAWSDCTKVAGFYSMMGVEYEPQILVDNKCIIPAEALAKKSFKIQVIGGRKDYTILSNKITVKQDGG